MSLSYTKPNWTNDEGTAINASRLQAISDVLDGLVNQTGTKPIVNIAFTDANMTVTYADGSIEMFENPNKGERGEEGASLGARHSKEGKVTTVELFNSETGETVDTFIVLDGLDGGGSGGGGDMYKAVYDADDDGIVDRASVADSVAWENTNHPTTLGGYSLESEVNALITNAIGGAIDGRY